MTDENMDLRTLLEKTADTDFLREMIGFTSCALCWPMPDARANALPPPY